jgi:predicted Rossmann-fold nucleotide-binding protein
MVQIAVCGPAECSDVEASWAYQVGALLAVRGAVVLTGGGPGVMAAAADGARSAAGFPVAIRPDGGRRDRSRPAADRAAAGRAAADRAAGDGADGDGDGHGGNRAVVTIHTGMGQARNAILVASADAVIAIGGSWGTLSEVALACRTGVPVVSLGGWRVLDVGGAEVPGVRAAADPAAAVAAALSP